VPEPFRWRPRQLGSLAKESVKEWVEDKSPKTAAALAYYSLFALGPLLLLVTAIAGVVFGMTEARAAVTGEIGRLLGKPAGETLDALMAAGMQGRTGVLAIVVGGVALLFGALGAFAQLREGLNATWEVEAKPVKGFWNKVRQAVRQNALSFAAVLGLGFLLLVSLVVGTAVTAIATRLGDALPGADALWQAFNLLFMLGVAATVFTLIFKFMPDAKVAWRDVWVGGAVTAVLFVAGEAAIGMYLGGPATASRYGAVGAVPVLLLWLYYSSMIVLFGAEVTQVYANRYGSRVRPSGAAYAIHEAVPKRHALPSEEGVDGGRGSGAVWIPPRREAGGVTQRKPGRRAQRRSERVDGEFRGLGRPVREAGRRDSGRTRTR
jgi:membrane protein